MSPDGWAMVVAPGDVCFCSARCSQALKSPSRKGGHPKPHLPTTEVVRRAPPLRQPPTFGRSRSRLRRRTGRPAPAHRGDALAQQGNGHGPVRRPARDAEGARVPRRTGTTGWTQKAEGEPPTASSVLHDRDRRRWGSTSSTSCPTWRTRGADRRRHAGLANDDGRDRRPRRRPRSCIARCWRCPDASVVLALLPVWPMLSSVLDAHHARVS